MGTAQAKVGAARAAEERRVVEADGRGEPQMAAVGRSPSQTKQLSDGRVGEPKPKPPSSLRNLSTATRTRCVWPSCCSR